MALRTKPERMCFRIRQACIGFLRTSSKAKERSDLLLVLLGLGPLSPARAAIIRGLGRLLCFSAERTVQAGYMA